MRKIIVKVFSKLLKTKPYMTKKALQVFWSDFKGENRTTFKQKFWAYKRGFASSRIIEYGLKEDNYKSYLSDLNYYRLFPLNNEYRYWINDKLTTKYILSKYNKYQPEYYYHLKDNKVLPIMDSPEHKNLTADSVVCLLKDKGTLALKQESGSLGEGFYKIEYKEKNFFVNNEKASKEELINLINSLDDYLVTEFIVTHKEINKVFPNVANTLRIMVIKDGNNPSQLDQGYIRFGTSRTKVVDNASAGGVFSMIDIKDGSFDGGHRKINGVLEKCDIHPDTQVPIKGTLPNWDFISSKLIEIADYLDELSWMGFDVAITDDGFKILEINSHPNITRYQYFQPLLEGSDPIAEFLNKKLKEKSLV